MKKHFVEIASDVLTGSLVAWLIAKGTDTKFTSVACLVFAARVAWNWFHYKPDTK